MITESTCRDVVRCLLNNTTHVGAAAQAHSLPNHDLYRRLLSKYSLGLIDDTLRWLELSGYLGRSGVGLMMTAGLWAYSLTEKGHTYAVSGNLPDADMKLLYSEEPYRVFIARQFRNEDDLLFTQISEALRQNGFSATDGKVDGLDAFRGEIIRKIRDARLFVCLLTTREPLHDGSFASSVWLYQETGAAIALGKKPLLLVEEGMHQHYAGELQKTYEYIPFNRNNFLSILPEVIRRLQSDLTVNHVPLPSRS